MRIGRPVPAAVTGRAAIPSATKLPKAKDPANEDPDLKKQITRHSRLEFHKLQSQPRVLFLLHETCYLFSDSVFL